MGQESFETELLKNLGIEAQVKPKSRRILSERLGTVVTRGEATLGLQQVSQLLPIGGIDYIGPLPREVERVTVFGRRRVRLHAIRRAGADPLLELTRGCPHRQDGPGTSSYHAAGHGDATS